VPEFAIITASRAVAATALERGAVVYVPALEMARWDDPGRFIALLPTIAHERETSHLIGIAERARSVVCDSAWMVARCAAEGLSVEAGPRCNLLNSYSFSAINGLGASRCWVSPELSLDQIEQLVIESPVPLTMTVRGAAELMITEHCELMAEGECDGVCGLCERRRKRHVLVDKKGYGFPVVTDASGRSHVYNSVPLDLLPFLDRIAPLVSRVVLDATLLDEGGALFELGELEQAVRALGSPDVEPPARIHGATTGHLFRGVL
jgi:putative protease